MTRPTTNFYLHAGLRKQARDLGFIQMGGDGKILWFAASLARSFDMVDASVRCGDHLAVGDAPGLDELIEFGQGDFVGGRPEQVNEDKAESEQGQADAGNQFGVFGEFHTRGWLSRRVGRQVARWLRE